jgi:RNA polymerase primary sigma factor
MIPIKNQRIILDSFSLLQESIGRAKESLSDRDYSIMNMRLGLDGKKPKTLEAIGKKHKITRERVRQVQNKFRRKRGFLKMSWEVLV